MRWSVSVMAEGDRVMTREEIVALGGWDNHLYQNYL